MRTGGNKQISGGDKKDTLKTHKWVDTMMQQGQGKAVFSVFIKSKANNTRDTGRKSADKISKSWKKETKVKTEGRRRNCGKLQYKLASLYTHTRARKGVRHIRGVA